MRKTLIPIIMFVVSIILVACMNSRNTELEPSETPSIKEPTQVITDSPSVTEPIPTITETKKEEEEDVILTDLAYYNYLSDSNPEVIITITGFGDIHLQLFPEIAENTVNNFISYIESGQYNSSEFHRIIKGFMIQGGAVKNTNRPIKGEFGSNGFNNPLSHTKGVISMARTIVEDSATSQFFIVHENSTYLDNNYAGFGGMTKGFTVLNKIATTPTGVYDYPLSKVAIENVTVNLNGYEPKPVVYA